MGTGLVKAQEMAIVGSTDMITFPVCLGMLGSSVCLIMERTIKTDLAITCCESAERQFICGIPLRFGGLACCQTCDMNGRG